MNPVTAITLFTMIWWTVLFAVLPIGTRPVAEPDEHTGWRGAPARPQMLRKILITTLISLLLFGLGLLIIRSDWLSFRSGWLALPED